MIEFQIYDFVEDHEKEEIEEETESDDKNDTPPELPKYIIHVFGRTEDDKSVYCKVKDFTPFFYVKLPESWDKGTQTKLDRFHDWLTSSENKKVWKKFRNGLIRVELKKAKEAVGFSDDKIYNYARLVFDNTFAMKKYRYMLEQNKIFIGGLTNKETKFEIYEANLPAMLRWSHIKKISGCSWVSTDKYKTVVEEEKESYCQIEISVNWKDLNPIKKDFNAPLRIAS